MNELAPVSAAPTKLPIMAGGKVSAIVPKSIDEAFRLAEAFCVAGMIPDSYKGSDNRETASRVMLGIMKGAEVGLPPVAALSNIYIVNKRPSVYGDGALAIVQANPEYAGHKEWYEGTEGQDSWIAKCEFYRRDPDTGAVTTYPGEFSWAQAKTAQLIRKGPWGQYPARMLKMRARAFGMRDSFSDALCGLSIVEEVQDIPTKPEKTDTAFLDVDVDTKLAAEVATDWPATARMFSEAVGKIETQADLDAFVDISSGQREVMKAEASDLWTFLEEEINKKSQSLAAPSK